MLFSFKKIVAISNLKQMIRLHRKVSSILLKVRYQSQSSDSSFLRAIQEPSRSSSVAIIDESGPTTYGDLDLQSRILAFAILSKGLLPDECQTIASFNDSNRNYVLSMLTTWKLGRRFLPLCPSHPEHELSYFLKDSKCDLVIHSKMKGNNNTTQLMSNLGVNTLNISDILTSNNDISNANSNILPNKIAKTNDTGLIVYTSGTTGKPKGVLHDESNIIHMIKGLVQAWDYTNEDKILHFLPLHHVHGILNKLLCMLYVGGTIEFLSNAKAPTIWKRLSQEYTQQMINNYNTYKKLSLFMAVPTIYAKMIEELKLYGLTHQISDHSMENYANILNLTLTPPLAATTTSNTASSGSSGGKSNQREKENELTLQDFQQGLQVLSNMRLNVSGSAAMPEPIFKQWQALTNQILLERYGMTEIGMALSNPYHGQRIMGSVGTPLPYVTCRLVDENECEINTVNTPGELRIKVSCLIKLLLTINRLQVYSHYISTC